MAARFQPGLTLVKMKSQATSPKCYETKKNSTYPRKETLNK